MDGSELKITIAQLVDAAATKLNALYLIQFQGPDKMQTVALVDGVFRLVELFGTQRDAVEWATLEADLRRDGVAVHTCVMDMYEREQVLSRFRTYMRT